MVMTSRPPPRTMITRSSPSVSSSRNSISVDCQGWLKQINGERMDCITVPSYATLNIGAHFPYLLQLQSRTCSNLHQQQNTNCCPARIKHSSLSQALGLWRAAKKWRAKEKAGTREKMGRGGGTGERGTSLPSSLSLPPTLALFAALQNLNAWNRLKRFIQISETYPM